MLSGGVPQGAPLSGLAQIPLSQGLPVPQASTGGGVNTLNSPLGTGNLGLIGALAQGAPISAGPIGPLAQFAGLGRKRRNIFYSAKQ
uniref:Uncharacterized protein n=1 Tax=Romanomermis culicivorax TaxID=13658 RepID=A0A915I4Y6_ROMCU